MLKFGVLFVTAAFSIILLNGCGSQPRVQGALPTANPPMYSLSHDNNQHLQKRGSSARVEAVDTGSTVASADENQVISLTNIERQKAGLPPLQMNALLMSMARAKATDMVNRNYFDHNSPTYGSPFDMMSTWKVQFSTAGENIAGNPSAAEAMTTWMNSPGHRANILNSQYSQIGVGVVDGGPYGKMLVQEFIHP